MTHLTIKNPFKINEMPQMAQMASFGIAHDRKKSFKINEMPQMAQMARQKSRGGGFGKQEKKKRE